jgi:WhiB family transcriptional regulator, redox-sensing transcriptional regulator
MAARGPASEATDAELERPTNGASQPSGPGVGQDPGPNSRRGAHVSRYEIPGEWAHQAVCRGNGRLFAIPFGVTQPMSPPLREQVSAARAICVRCPVLAECRAWALSRPDPANGMVAGGLTPHERQRQRAARG